MRQLDKSVWYTAWLTFVFALKTLTTFHSGQWGFTSSCIQYWYVIGRIQTLWLISRVCSEVKSKTKRAFTRNQRTAVWWNNSKSELTDHANQANHTIDWKKTTVIDREQDRPTRWIHQAVHICTEGHRAMNRDESSFISWVTPTTAFLIRQLIVASRLGRTEYQLLLMKISWWDRNVKEMLDCDTWIFNGIVITTQ